MRAGVVPASSRGIDQLLEPLRYFPKLPVFEIAVERSYGIATVEIYDVRVVVHGVAHGYRQRSELRVASEDDVLDPE
jgi:hypothetical protein